MFTDRYGMSWMLRPVVILLFALAIVGLVRPLLQDVRSQGGVAVAESGPDCVEGVGPDSVDELVRPVMGSGGDRRVVRAQPARSCFFSGFFVLWPKNSAEKGRRRLR